MYPRFIQSRQLKSNAKAAHYTKLQEMGIEPLSKWGFKEFPIVFLLLFFFSENEEFPIVEIGLATKYICDLIFSSYMYRDAFNDRYALNDKGLA